MIWAEFEEKEYENPLYRELLVGSPNLYTPGQVFEGQFGIDAALQAMDTNFWSILGYPYAPDGVVLGDFNFGVIWRKGDHKRPLPNFSVNLLVHVAEELAHKGIQVNSCGVRGV